MDPDDPFDDADVDLALVENAALLDVELDVPGDAAWSVFRFADPRGVTADPTDLLGECGAVAPGPRHLIGGQVPDVAPASREPALLVAPNDDVQWVAIAVAALRERVSDFDRRARSDVAVVVAALRYGVDVGAEEDRRRGGSRAGRAGPDADDVANGIDADRETGCLHSVHHEAATGDVRVTECHSAHAALRIRPELRKIGEMLIDARPVHPPALPIPLSVKSGQRDERLDELAPFHFTCPYQSPFSRGQRADRNSRRRRAP